MSQVVPAGARELNRRGLPPLIEAMTHPEFYPHRPATVELRQTHISYVLLAGEYVYKVKKTVRFPFADCSTLAARRHLCHEEVRLNPRLAPDVYLGVVPIIADNGRYVLGAETSISTPGVSEYAVKMRRLPEEMMLDRLLIRGAVGKEAMRALAFRLAAFHREAPASRSWSYGSAAAIWRMVLGNLEEAERCLGRSAGGAEFAAIESYSRAFMTSHWELLNERARGRRVVEGHGDLRAEQICLSGGDIQIFDCLEFSERLRYSDVASEIAFLAMDLERLGARPLADELVDSYVRASGDEAVALLVPFYKCYRALVRAKVESLKSLEQEVPAAERERAQELARSYCRLACGCARWARPFLIVVCGLAGSGKSTVARMLRHRTGSEIFGSDATRKRLAGIEPTTHVKTEYGAEIYGEPFNRRTYRALLAGAEARLREGDGAIIDATFKDPADRRAALTMAARVDVPVLFVECRAHEPEVLRRLQEREGKPDTVSDAGRAVYLRQRAESAPMSELPDRCHVTVDTAADLDQIATEIEKSLERLFQTSHEGVRAAP